MSAESSSSGEQEPPAIALSQASLTNPSEESVGRPSPSERGFWSHRVEFFLSLVGFAVGLGNVWRFPSLVYMNGGGAFLIPYLISLFLAALPLVYLEVGLGQFLGAGQTLIFRWMSPIFCGVGWGMTLVCIYISVYYCNLMAWSIFYLVESFIHIPDVSWGHCDNKWNNAFCYSELDNKRCQDREGFSSNATAFNKTCYNDSSVWSLVKKRESPTVQYFNDYMYMTPPLGSFDLGHLQWHLSLCLLAAWIIVFLCLIRGIRSQGKVVYFTAIFPYIMLTVLLIRGALLDGAIEGIKFYIKPNITKLTEAQVWYAAGGQIFFSLSPGWGVMSTMGSFNKFNNNLYRTVLAVSLINSATSIYAGFAIFSTLGYMANKLNVSISDVAKSGTELAFVTYPQAISHMPAPFIWAILFYLMLITLALDSQFAIVDTIVMSIIDTLPTLNKYKWVVTLAVCITEFFLGLPICLEGGEYIFIIMDNYSSLVLIYLCLFEIICVSYVYGIHRVIADFRLMMGVPDKCIWRWIGATGYVWVGFWLVITPLSVVAILVAALVQFAPAGITGYVFPEGAQTFGLIELFLPLYVIIACGAYQVMKVVRDRKRLALLFRPSSDYCPAEERLLRHQQVKSSQVLLAPDKQVKSLHPCT